jgi:probable rRNA maturation factor
MISVFFSNKTRSKINTKKLENTVVCLLRKYKIKAGEVSVVLAGDKLIKDLNRQYRGQDKITDVLAFPGEGEFLGEILISWPQIKRQSKSFSGNAGDELIFILVHGLLHLLGYNDKTEKSRQTMVKLGEEFINLDLKKNKLVTKTPRA